MACIPEIRGFSGDFIYTRRLQLRKIQAEDIPLYVAWSSSAEANGIYLTPECLSEEEGLRRLAAGLLWNQQSRTFLIEIREGHPIGIIHYWMKPETNGTAVAAIKIALPAFRNRGYGTEAQKYLIIHLFDRLNIESIEMYTAFGNRAQQRCLQKLGFEASETLTYEDQRVVRTGLKYQLNRNQYRSHPIYRFHYE